MQYKMISMRMHMLNVRNAGAERVQLDPLQEASASLSTEELQEVVKTARMGDMCRTNTWRSCA